ncbi:MAG TPA: hypothetical protein VKK79_07170 [Candidatus Lokiarchaeia archaeon]|nr:hypothetical protein [Candidatus Lokiarchaeia archaeon]
MPALIEANAFKSMVLFGARFANATIPPEEWKEVYGFLLGFIENKTTLHVQNMVPFIHGSATEVQFGNEDYGLAEEVVERAENAGQFLVGWFHTHPGLGLFLSDVDILNQIGFQAVNPLAIAIVFDPSLVGNVGYGFKVFALDDPEKGITANTVETEYSIQKLDPTFIAATLVRVASDAAFQRPFAPEFKEIAQMPDIETKSQFLGEYFTPVNLKVTPPPELNNLVTSNLDDLETWADSESPPPDLVPAKGAVWSEVEMGVPSAEWEQWASEESIEQEKLQQQVEEAEITGQPPGPVLEKLADTYLEVFNYDETTRYLERAQQSYEAMGNQLAAFRLGIRIARVYYKQGFLDQAILLLDDLMEKYQPTNFPLRVFALNTYAAIYEDLGEYENAYTTLIESVQIAQAAVDVRLFHGTILNLADVFIFLQNFKSAMNLALQSLQFYRQSKDPYGESVALGTIAEIFLKTNPGYATLAAGILARSLELKETLDDKEGMVEILALIGQSAIFQRRLDNAEECLFRALDLSREVQQPRFEGKILEALGVLFFVKRDYSEAQTYFGLATEVYRDQLGNSLKALELIQRAANARKLAGDIGGAIDFLLNALELAKSRGSGATEGQILFQLGLLYEQEGNLEASITSFEDARQVYLSVFDEASADQMSAQVERIRLRL